ncbi:MAG TPA: hypothetical protein VJ810_26405 [Blastocatellia bacterium]|nr:hypothetical protein [Blastocatellia bacterium]
MIYLLAGVFFILLLLPALALTDEQRTFRRAYIMTVLTAALLCLSLTQPIPSDSYLNYLLVVLDLPGELLYRLMGVQGGHGVVFFFVLVDFVVGFLAILACWYLVMFVLKKFLDGGRSK